MRVEPAGRERVRSQHAVRLHHGLHLLQKFSREHVLGDIFVVEGVEQDKVVLLALSSSPFDKDAAVFFEDMDVRTGPKVEIFLGDANDRSVDFNDVHLDVGINTQKRIRQRSTSEPDHQHAFRIRR